GWRNLSFVSIVVPLVIHRYINCYAGGDSERGVRLSANALRLSPGGICRRPAGIGRASRRQHAHGNAAISDLALNGEPRGNEWHHHSGYHLRFVRNADL